jgi:hypothetical protein
VPIGAHRTRDELLKTLAIFRREWPTQALTMIGQDDELIGPSCSGTGVDDPCDLVVDPADRTERLRPIRAAVVSHRVVAREVDVDDGRAHPHLRQHELGREDPHGAVEDGPLGRGIEATVHPRPDPTKHLASALVQLRGELADHPGDDPNRVDRAQQERPQPDERTGRTGLLGDRGHRQVGPSCIAGHEVADARPSGRQKTLAVGLATGDLSGVTRVVGDEKSLCALLVPAKARDLVIVAVHDPGLARGRRRRQQREPWIEDDLAPVDQPAQERSVAVVDRPVQGWQSEPVDLDNQQSGVAGPADRTSTGHEIGEERDASRPDDGAPASDSGQPPHAGALHAESSPDPSDARWSILSGYGIHLKGPPEGGVARSHPAVSAPAPKRERGD